MKLNKIINKKEGFVLFHFNLAFSSIKFSDHKKVIKKCYYPILEIALKSDIAIAIELSGWTLERINELDKSFIHLLNKLIKEKKNRNCSLWLLSNNWSISTLQS